MQSINVQQQEIVLHLESFALTLIRWRKEVLNGTLEDVNMDTSKKI